MPDTPPTNVNSVNNVKIYDRPERKKLSSAVIVAMVLIAIIVAFFLFRTLNHPTPGPGAAQRSISASPNPGNNGQ